MQHGPARASPAASGGAGGLLPSPLLGAHVCASTPAVVRCGVAWCGVARRGAVWRDVRCGVVRGVVRCGVVRRAWCGVVGCGVAWCGVV